MYGNVLVLLIDVDCFRLFVPESAVPQIENRYPLPIERSANYSSGCYIANRFTCLKGYEKSLACRE